MTKSIILAVLSVLMTTNVWASFTCKYDYSELGFDVAAEFVVDQINGDGVDWIVMRDRASLKEIYTWEVLETGLTRVGQMMYSADGIIFDEVVRIDLFVPRVLPNPGRLFVYDEKGEVEENILLRCF